MSVVLAETPQVARRAAMSDAVVQVVDVLVGWLQRVSPPADDAATIDRIAAFERLQAAAAGAQVVEIDRLAATHEAADVAAQVGLATKVSVATGSRRVAQAEALVHDLPETLSLLRDGQISSWVASLVARETSALGADDRRAADLELGPRLAGLGPRQVEAAARRTAIALDPASPLRRSRTARSDRRVSLRPAPDTMALLTGFLPVEQGVAAFAALDQAARALRAKGDARSLGQIMADTLVERVTGQRDAPAVPLEVGVVIGLDALAGRSTRPARIGAPGTPGVPVPAELATDLIETAERLGSPVWLRRLLTDPVDHTVATVDTRRRRFTGGVATLIESRDQTCRTPYCSAPIRHLDHITPWRDIGSTTASGGQGLCAKHNQTKELPGWISVAHTRRPGTPHTVTVTTPTGHRYTSYAPPALGP